MASIAAKSTRHPPAPTSRCRPLAVDGRWRLLAASRQAAAVVPRGVHRRQPPVCLAPTTASSCQSSIEAQLGRPKPGVPSRGAASRAGPSPLPVRVSGPTRSKTLRFQTTPEEPHPPSPSSPPLPSPYRPPPPPMTTPPPQQSKCQRQLWEATATATTATSQLQQQQPVPSPAPAANLPSCSRNISISPERSTPTHGTFTISPERSAPTHGTFSATRQVGQIVFLEAEGLGWGSLR